MGLVERLSVAIKRKEDLKKIKDDWREVWLTMQDIKTGRMRNFRVAPRLSHYITPGRVSGFSEEDNSLPLEHPEGAYLYYKQVRERLNKILEKGYIPEEELAETDPVYLHRLSKAA